MGDLTQILLANLAAHYRSALSVAVGSVLAFWSVAALALIGGQGLLRFVNTRTLRFVTAGILMVLGGVVSWQAPKWSTAAAWWGDLGAESGRIRISGDCST